MGHPKHEFETMMMTLSHGPKVEQTLPIFDLSKALTESLTAMEALETHCFKLSHEILKSHSENFTQTALNFDVDGLIAQYHCSRDDRTYTVKITASK